MRGSSYILKEGDEILHEVVNPKIREFLLTGFNAILKHNDADDADGLYIKNGTRGLFDALIKWADTPDTGTNKGMEERAAQINEHLRELICKKRDVGMVNAEEEYNDETPSELVSPYYMFYTAINTDIKNTNMRRIVDLPEYHPKPGFCVRLEPRMSWAVANVEGASFLDVYRRNRVLSKAAVKTMHAHFATFDELCAFLENEAAVDSEPTRIDNIDEFRQHQKEMNAYYIGYFSIMMVLNVWMQEYIRNFIDARSPLLELMFPISMGVDEKILIVNADNPHKAYVLGRINQHCTIFFYEMAREVLYNNNKQHASTRYGETFDDLRTSDWYKTIMEVVETSKKTGASFDRPRIINETVFKKMWHDIYKSDEHVVLGTEELVSAYYDPEELERALKARKRLPFEACYLTPKHVDVFVQFYKQYVADMPTPTGKLTSGDIYAIVASMAESNVVETWPAGQHDLTDTEAVVLYENLDDSWPEGQNDLTDTAAAVLYANIGDALEKENKVELGRALIRAYVANEKSPYFTAYTKLATPARVGDAYYETIDDDVWFNGISIAAWL